MSETEKASRNAQFYDYNPPPITLVDGIHIGFAHGAAGNPQA
ncbi:MAG TPA: hypothetical protein VHK70_08535 [Burkholderiaceae bacterium]|nr:hypothetical protein [Burkholderiaceae bacterium]